MIHPRDSRLQFEPHSHRYTIDGQNNYKSVSKFMEEWFRTWAQEVIDPKDESEEAKSKRETNEKKKQNGTDLHTWIEQFYDNPEDGNCKTNGDFVQRYLKTIAAEGFTLSDLKDANKAWYNFIKFAIANQHWYLVRSEWRIFSEKYRLAGTPDAIFKIPMSDGSFRTVICDWKRVARMQFTAYVKMGNPSLFKDILYPSCNYWQYHIQLNLYRIILEDHYDIKIDAMLIIRLSEYSSNFEIFLVEKDEKFRKMLKMGV